MKNLFLSIATLKTDGLTISIDASLTGMERITVNGVEVSKKRSFFGTEHRFQTRSGEVVNKYILKTGYGLYGFTMNLSRNNDPILIMPKNRPTMWAVAAVLVAVILILTYLLLTTFL